MLTEEDIDHKFKNPNIKHNIYGAIKCLEITNEIMNLII